MTLKPKSSKDLLEELRAEAAEAFAEHVLYENDPVAGRWAIRRPGTGIYFAEMFAGRNGALYVGGDIDACIFSFGPALGGGPIDAGHLELLRWIGECEDLGYYVRQKAGIGLNDRGLLVDSFDAGAALHDLEDLRQRFFEDYGVESLDELRAEGTPEEAERLERKLAAVNEAADRVQQEDDRQAVCQILYDAGIEPEDFSCLGMTISTRVVYAWAACRRTCELIRAAEEEQSHA